ncbi:hypothetical protein [Methanococcus maripaludis]|uniref:hypothetical protein n=1 Tax=Methanococcus maripaludis TaxID=39152 RepID=UPI00241DF37D|nr:hypothetical protein [Methanococcus maripaludis]
MYEYHDYLHDGNSLHDELYDKKLISETEYVAYCRGKIMPKPEQKEYKPKIIEYQLDKKVMEKLNIMVFDDCSLKWAEYAMQYRSGREKTLNMDIDVIFAPTMDGISPILSKLQREFKKTGKLTDEMYNNVLPRNYAEYGVGESWQMYFRTLKSLELLGNSIIELR